MESVISVKLCCKPSWSRHEWKTPQEVLCSASSCAPTSSSRSGWLKKNSLSDHRHSVRPPPSPRGPGILAWAMPCRPYVILFLTRIITHTYTPPREPGHYRTRIIRSYGLIAVASKMLDWAERDCNHRACWTKAARLGTSFLERPRLPTLMVDTQPKVVPFTSTTTIARRCGTTFLMKAASFTAVFRVSAARAKPGIRMLP